MPNFYQIKPESFTRADKLDVNGNPRYILHFCHMYKDSDVQDPSDIFGKYASAVKRANKLGGKKYHNKKYGGGIIFQSYNTQELSDSLNALMHGPLVWDDLWDTMKANPNSWVETTEEMYWDMLECLPPKCMNNRAFLVGAADSHNDQGEAIFACFKKQGTEFFARYRSVSQFQFV